MEQSPLTISDFSGGKTDYYLNAAFNKFQDADNFILVRHVTQDGITGKLYTRPGSTIYDATNYQIPAGAQRIGTLKNFVSASSRDLLVQSSRKFYYIASGSWQTLQGPTGNDVFSSGTTTNNVVSLATWNNHLFVANDAYTLPSKIYKDGSGVLQVRTAGLPALASTPVVTPTGNTGKSFIYRFIMQYTYQVGTVNFEDLGPIGNNEVFVNNADAPQTNQNNITGIPVLSNGAITNYDTASPNLVIGIYRTVNASSGPFYFVDTVPNGTTTYTDNKSDAFIQNRNQLLYTEGGVVENNPPLPCKVIHVRENVGYYGNVKEGTELRTNRLYQSIPDDIDSVPDTFFIDLDDEIVGISSVNDIPVVFCKKFTYRIDGQFDELGRGGMNRMKISDSAGCVSSQGIVQTLEGIYWAGQDAFYFTDGFQVKKINKDWNQTYANLVDTLSQPLKPLRIQGKFDSINRRIWWSVWENTSNSDVDKNYILDLNYGLRDDMPFTSASGGSNWSPTAIEFVDNNLIRADKRGYIFKHSNTIYTDPKINTLVPPSQWIQATIMYSYKSFSTPFGTEFLRKYVTRISSVCQNETNLSLQIVSNNDDSRLVQNLTPIRFRGNYLWGDPDVYWGDPNIVWDKLGLISDFRRFPAGGLRCLYKQIYLQNAFVAIVNSDLIGDAVVDSGAKTVTLVNASSFDWPSNSVDYFIAFQSDNYTNQYQISARTSDILTVLDPKGTLNNSTQGWVIRGYPKGEITNLISYTIGFSIFSKTQDHFSKGQTGEVGASDI